ncbi:MAG: hypothetical protein ACE5F7_02280 [Nitrospiria bacterium]
MNASHYDVVFVGEGLISLAAAATLAKKGKSVLLLGGADALAQNIPNEAFCFSLGPCFYFGYEKQGAMEGFFSKLAYPIPSLEKKGLRFRKITPILQVVLPGHRVSLHADDASYFDEVNREFRPFSQKLKAFFNQIEREAAVFYPHVGQFPQIEIEGVGDRLSEWKKQIDSTQAIQQQQKIKASALLEPYNFPPNIQEYFKLLFLFAYQKPLEAGSAFELIQLLSSFQKGGVCFSGGYPVLASFFHALIKARDGVILKETAVLQPEHQGDQTAGLTLSNGSEISATHVVVARASEKKRADFYFKIPENLIPEPMNDKLLMTWGASRPKNVEDLLVVRLSPPAGEAAELSKDRLMTVSLLLCDDASLSRAVRSDLEFRVLDRLRWLMPLSELSIQCIRHPESEAPQPDFFRVGGDFSGPAKEVVKGVLSYVQPKGRKKMYVIQSEQSDFIGWGSAFLAGHRLARVIEKST